MWTCKKRSIPLKIEISIINRMRKFYCIMFFGKLISTKLSWLICTFPSQLSTFCMLHVILHFHMGKGYWKINCDGARFEKENSARIGFVICNSEGMVLGLLSKQLSQAFTPLQIKAIAVKTALQFAANLRVQHDILETDSLVLVKALREGTSSFQ